MNRGIHLTVVTAYGLTSLVQIATEMHTNLGRLNCANCDTQTTEHVSRKHAIGKTVLHGCDIFILLVSWINRL